MEAKTLEAKTYPVTHSEAEWRKLLSPEQFHIMREHGTERPGSCALNFEKRAGTFYCAGCEQALFKSKKKFESGTGWPSFNDPEPGSIEETVDRARLWVVEARPAGAALELLLRLEQRLPAARAGERAGALLVIERAASRPLGAVLAHDVVLLGRQQLAPLGVGMGDRIGLHIHGFSPVS